MLWSFVDLVEIGNSCLDRRLGTFDSRSTQPRGIGMSLSRIVSGFDSSSKFLSIQKRSFHRPQVRVRVSPRDISRSRGDLAVHNFHVSPCNRRGRDTDKLDPVPPRPSISRSRVCVGSSLPLAIILAHLRSHRIVPLQRLPVKRQRRFARRSRIFKY